MCNVFLIRSQIILRSGMHVWEFCIYFLCCLSSGQLRRITYPSVHHEFLNNCTFSDGSAGQCKQDCGYDAQQTAREEYKICYFLHDKAFTCCKEPSLPMNPVPLKMGSAANICAIPGRHHIVLGKLTQPKEFPFMAALGWREYFSPTQYDFKCGGALISATFVLTAAHCARINGIQPEVILLGGVNLTDIADNLFNVKRVVIHPDFNDESIYNDIALIELDKGAGGKFACIWTKLPLENDDLTAIGYGDVSFGGSGSDYLLKANFSIISNRECQQFYEIDENMPLGILDSQLCAKDPAKRSDTCQGDSGGPLIMYTLVNGVRKAQIVGITSFGMGCAFSTPGIYTRVSHYLNWVESVAWPNGCC